MRKLLLIVTICLTVLNLSGQHTNNSKIIDCQEKIAKLIGDLKKETSVNYMKHINQVEGYKQGLWIESTNGEIWFVNYDQGLKHGILTIYYTSGVKYVEANYDNGFLIDKVTIYDAKGRLYETYENIMLNDSIVEKQLEKAEGGMIYFSKEKHRYDYKAYVKRYTSEGVLYKEGYGLFDDNWIFYLFPIGEWKYPEENE